MQDPERALQKVTSILSNIKKVNYRIHTNDLLWDASPEQIAFEKGKKAYDLVEKWGLKAELSLMKNRDFALVHAPVDYVAPRNPRKLLKMAAPVGYWHIVKHYGKLVKQKDLSLMLKGLLVGRRSGVKDGVTFVLENFTEADRNDAKIILQTWFTKELYPLMRHFGSLLYRWAARGFTAQRDLSTLALLELGCPVDTAALKQNIKNSRNPGVIRMIVEAGAEVTDSIVKLARQYLAHWLLLDKDQTLQMYARYGVDPATINEWYPHDSFEYRIRAWLRLISSGPVTQSRVYEERNFPGCLARIAEVEQR